MANDEVDVDDFLSDEPKKKESFMPFLAAIGLISIVAVGAGWIVSDQLGGGADVMPASTEAPVENTDTAEKGDKPSSNDASAKYIDSGPSKIVKLEPIIVSMAGNGTTFLRMEIALVFDKEVEGQNEEARLRIGTEIAAFMQTLTLQQVSGPSGFLHLKEDLLDRARLSTDGAARDLLVLSMVSE